MEPFNYKDFLPDPSRQLLESMKLGAQMVNPSSSEELAIRKNQLELQNLQIAAARESAKTAPGIGQANLQRANAEARAAEYELSRKQKIESGVKYFLENPQATISDPQVMSAIPYMDRTQVDSLAQANNLRAQGMFDSYVASGQTPPAEFSRKMAREALLAPTQDQKIVMDQITNLPDSAKKVLGNTFLKITGATFNGNLDAAATEADKLAESFKQSPDPRLQKIAPVLRGFVESVTSEGFDKSYLGSQVMLLAELIGDKGMGDSVYKIVSDHAKQAIEAPIKQAELDAKRLDVKIKEMEASGSILPKEKQKLETAERVHVEAQPFVRKYIDSRTAFEMMKTAEPTASGDEALLTQFVKMGDPGSVVSVTEKGGVRNVTLSDYIGSLQAKLANEGSLGDAKRKELKNQAYKMLKASEKQYKEYESKLTDRYKKQGLDPENIFVLPSSPQSLEETKKAEMSPEEQRIRGMLRPAAGFGNTTTPSVAQPQGTAAGMSPEVQSLLNKYR